MLEGGLRVKWNSPVGVQLEPTGSRRCNIGWIALTIRISFDLSYYNILFCLLFLLKNPGLAWRSPNGHSQKREDLSMVGQMYRPTISQNLVNCPFNIRYGSSWN